MATEKESIIFHVREEDFDLEKICMGRGFERISTSGVQGMVALAKVPCPPLVTKANWGALREVFAKNTGIDIAVP